jgi:transposase
MEGEFLRVDQWEKVKPFVPGGRKGKRGPRSDGRRFFDALLWVARSGARWRDLPERFGPYQTAKRRYYRWIEMGVFDRLFEAIACDPDLEWLMIDATVIRAQAQAAGARRKRGTSSPGSRPLARWLRHQAACRRRCPRAANTFFDRPWSAE